MLSTVAWLWQLPATLFPFDGGSILADWAAFVILFGLYTVVMVPFDVAAGFSIPRSNAGFLSSWLRCISLQGLVMTLSALAVYHAGRALGIWAGAVALALCQGLLAAFLRKRTPAGPRVIALAMLWNLAGFLLAANLPGAGVARLWEFVTTLLALNLWAALGLAVLPVLGRQLSCHPSPVAAFLSWAQFGMLSRSTPSAIGRFEPFP